MLDDEQALRLLQGVIEATRRGHIQWERGGVSQASSVHSALIKAPQTFVSRGKKSNFQIASSDSGAAPYSFQATEFQGTRQIPVTSLRSSLDFHSKTQFEINGALEGLFHYVDASTESGDEIVDRILEGLEDGPTNGLPRWP